MSHKINLFLPTHHLKIKTFSTNIKFQSNLIQYIFIFIIQYLLLNIQNNIFSTSFSSFQIILSTLLFKLSEQKKEDYAPNTYEIRQNSTPVVTSSYNPQTQQVTLRVQVPFQTGQYPVISFANDSLQYSNSNSFGSKDLKEYQELSYLCVENQTWQNFTYWTLQINSGNYMTYQGIFNLSNQYFSTKQFNDSSYQISTKLYVIDFELKDGKRRQTYEIPINIYSSVNVQIDSNVTLEQNSFYEIQQSYQRDNETNKTILYVTLPYYVYITSAVSSENNTLSIIQNDVEEQCAFFVSPIIYGYQDILNLNNYSWTIDGYTYNCENDSVQNVRIVYTFTDQFTQQNQFDTNNYMFNITRINGSHFQVTNLSSNVYGYTCDGNDEFHLIYNNGFERANSKCNDLRLYVAITQNQQIIQKQVYRFNMDFYFYTYDSDYLTPGTTCEYSKQQYEKYRNNK